MKELVRKAQILHKFSSAYRPSTNGLVERAVGSVTQLINKYCTEYVSDNWDLLLPSVQLALNTRVAEKSGQSPFFSFYFRNNGSQGIFGFDNSAAVPDPIDAWFNTQEFFDLHDVYLKEIARCKQEASAASTQYLDSKHSIDVRVPVGTHVFVKVVRNDKSHSIWEGPYIVTGHDDRDNHVVKQLKGGRGALTLDRVFPREQLKVLKYRSTNTVDDVRFIEKILDREGSPGSYRYLVKYRGYEDPKDQCWLDEVDFDDKTLFQRYNSTLRKRLANNNKNGKVKDDINTVVSFRPPKKGSML